MAKEVDEIISSQKAKSNEKALSSQMANSMANATLGSGPGERNIKTTELKEGVLHQIALQNDDEKSKIGKY